MNKRAKFGVIVLLFGLGIYCVASIQNTCSAKVFRVESFETGTVGRTPSVGWTIKTRGFADIRISAEQASDGLKALSLSNQEPNADNSLGTSFCYLKPEIREPNATVSFDVYRDDGRSRLNFTLVNKALIAGPSVALTNTALNVNHPDGPVLESISCESKTWYRVSMTVPDLNESEWFLKIEELDVGGEGKVIYDSVGPGGQPFPYRGELNNIYALRIIEAGLPTDNVYLDNIVFSTDPR